MLRLWETRTGQVVGVRPGPLRLYVHQPDDLRVCLTADVLRRVALRLRLRVLTTAAHTVDHGRFSIPRLDAGDPLPGALGVGKLTSGASVGVAEWTSPPPETVEPAALRLALLRHRYREETHIRPESVSEAAADLARWRGRLAEWATHPSQPIHAPYAEESLAALCDDLDVPRALTVLERMVDDQDVAPGSLLETALQLDQILALELPSAIGTR